MAAHPALDTPGAPGAGAHGPARTRRARARALLPGLALVTAITVVASAAGRVIPVVGPPVFGVLIGAGVALLRVPSPRVRPGVQFATRSVLKTSVVLLGTGITVGEVVAIGGIVPPGAPGHAGSGAGGSSGHRSGARGGPRPADPHRCRHRDLRRSAIVATDAVIDVSDADVSYAVATIFVCNVAAVLTFPAVGHTLGLSPHAFGLWAGTAVNDLSSVVATSAVFGHGAGTYAVVVKLTRTLMIVPIALVLSAWRNGSTRRPTTGRPVTGTAYRTVVPVFVGWFLVAVALDSLGLVPRDLHVPLSTAAGLMITMALSAIGLSTRPRRIRAAGWRPLALGVSLWLLVASAGLVLQSLQSVVVGRG